MTDNWQQMEHDDADDPAIRQAVRYLGHARWMVESGQYRGTARDYLECQRPSPMRDEALRMVERNDRRAGQT
jgi:hypothetical protein